MNASANAFAFQKLIRTAIGCMAEDPRARHSIDALKSRNRYPGDRALGLRRQGISWAWIAPNGSVEDGIHRVTLESKTNNL